MTYIILAILMIVLLTIAFDRQPYKKTIKQWSSMFRMKIKHHGRYSDIFEVDVVDNVMYISRFNKAVHSEIEYLYSVAHEFGHLVDHAYRDYYDQESKLTGNKAIYNDEVRAWRIARSLLQQTTFYDEKIFNKLRAKCLEEYRTALKL